MRDNAAWRFFWALLIGVVLGWGMGGFYWHSLGLFPLSMIILAFVFAVTSEDVKTADS